MRPCVPGGAAFCSAAITGPNQHSAARYLFVRRGEVDQFNGAWLQGHGLSVGSEALGLFPRVPRAQPEASECSRMRPWWWPRQDAALTMPLVLGEQKAQRRFERRRRQRAHPQRDREQAAGGGEPHHRTRLGARPAVGQVAAADGGDGAGDAVDRGLEQRKLGACAWWSSAAKVCRRGRRVAEEPSLPALV